MKKVLILGYVKKNLGDDLFISMLLNRYPYVQFELYVSSLEYVEPFKKYKNIKFVIKDINQKNMPDVNKYMGGIYIAGSIFQENVRSINKKEQELSLILQFKKNKIPFYYISSNYGPTYTEKFAKVCEDIISNVTSINFRDQYSYNKFKKMKHVKYFPDLVFSLNYKKAKTIKDSIGITLIEPFKTKRAYKYNSFQYYKFLENNIINLIDSGKEVYLFSFCKKENDELMLNSLYNGLNDKYQQHIKKIYYRGNIKQFLDVYSSMEYMVCTRFHATILSIIFRQKAYVVSYSDKITNALMDENINIPVIHINDQIEGKLLDLKDFVQIDSKRIVKISKEAQKQFSETDKLFKNTIINENYEIEDTYKKTNRLIVLITLVLKKRVNQKIKSDNLLILNNTLKGKQLDKLCYNNCLKELGYECNQKQIINKVKTGPLLSIIVPTYKRSDYLEKCLNSILCQSYKNIEIVIIDDYPLSNNEQMINDQFKQHLKYIKYNKNANNLGAGKSRQKGYSLATGKYIVFCDDDDFYVDYNYFEYAIDKLEKNNKLNFFGCSALNFYQTENLISENILNCTGIINNKDFIKNFQNLYTKPTSTFTTIFRKEPLDQINFKDVEMMNDSIIYSYSLVSNDNQIELENKIIGFYRIHSINISANLKIEFMIDNLEENKRIANILKEKNIIPHPEIWWRNKILTLANYYIRESKPKIKDYLKLRNWCFRNLDRKEKNTIKEMDKTYIIKVLKSIYLKIK